MGYLPLVKQVAARTHLGLPRQVELGDLEGYGLQGLLEAVERYDPGRGVPFEPFAVQRIRGAILDALRKEAWAPQLLSRARQYQKCLAELEARLGRSPEPAELATALGVTVEQLAEREQEVAAAYLLSLDEPGETQGEPLGHRVIDPTAPDPEGLMLLAERKEQLAAAIERLPERERLVITLFYYEELTPKEIAEVMGLSQARISQLRSKAILRLRGRLGRQKAQLLL